MDTTRYVHHRLRTWHIRAKGAEARCAELTTLCDALTAALEEEQGVTTSYASELLKEQVARQKAEQDLQRIREALAPPAESLGHEEIVQRLDELDTLCSKDKSVGHCDHRLVFDDPEPEPALPGWLRDYVPSPHVPSTPEPVDDVLRGPDGIPLWLKDLTEASMLDEDQQPSCIQDLSPSEVKDMLEEDHIPF